MPKNALAPFHIFQDESMVSDIVGAATNIQYLDNIAIQLNFSGNATGTFAVETSLDHAEYFGQVTNEGLWTAIPLDPSPVAEGQPDSIIINLTQIASPWIHITYTTTFIESGSITTVADVASSLNSKYFLLDGAQVFNWYVWFNVDSAGVDPMIADRTGIEVPISAGDSADDVAAALGTALAACTSIETIVVASNVVTFVQTDPGHGSLADGTAPTGFTFGYTAPTGALNAYISGKAI